MKIYIQGGHKNHFNYVNYEPKNATDKTSFNFACNHIAINIIQYYTIPYLDLQQIGA